MPIYEYVCMSCESHFEELVRHDESAKCPDCGTTKVQRQLSVFAASKTKPATPEDRRRSEFRRLWARKLWLPLITDLGRLTARIATAELSLASYGEAVADCTRCALAKGRTQVVFGSGSPTADLMFVGEAPGFHEDKQGVPFVGAAGQLLGKLLNGIGMQREEVYIANVLRCRPPGNRDPQPDEIESCEGHLFKQIELISPKVVATLGNFFTKLLSGKPLGITRVHGVEQQVTLGGSTVLLYPLFHPAAALYTPRMLDVLETDFRRLPELLGRTVAPPAPAPRPTLAAPPEPAAPSPSAAEPVQLGLF